MQALHSSLQPRSYSIAQVGHGFPLAAHTHEPPTFIYTTSGLASWKSGLGRWLSVSSTLRDQPVLGGWWIFWFWAVFFRWQSSRCLWPGKQGEDQVLRWSCPPSQTESAQSTGCATHSAVTTTQLCVGEQDVMRFSHPLT